jgi:lantibiotic modifying enzyme
MTWEILIKDEKAKPYKEKLAEIAEVLEKNSGSLQENLGLMGGKIGLALFFFYYARFTAEDRYADYAVDIISDIFDAINDEEKPFTYHTHAGGLAGIGWSIELLAQNEFIDADTNDVLESLDPYLHKAMIYDIQNKNYDFLHGAVGNGTYFLSRLASPNAKNYVSELVDELEKTSETDDDGSRKWKSVLNREEGNEGYNLSLSHGLASIIAFLGKAVEAGINKEKSSMLLNGAVQYLLKHKLDRTKFNSNFPSWIDIKEPDQLHPSRLAWCYGDLGVALSLWHTAKSAGNKEWEKIAAEVLLDSTSRKDVKENSVIDAGLCHGAAGIMHIYNRAYQYTGNDTFKETTLYWAEHTLKMATHEDGYAGYKAWHTEKYGGWLAEAGFLEGVSGIGLSLISLISDIEPTWDRALFCS